MSLGATMDTEKKTQMRQCECGAYRLVARVNDEWVWAAGCRACDTIERLRILLEAGVKVTRGSKATMDPERLKRQRDRAEEEVETLKRELGRVTEERDEARIHLKRAQHSARAAKSAMERMREGCNLVHMAGPEWN